MIKKVAVAVSGLIVAVAMVACGNDGENSGNDSGPIKIGLLSVLSGPGASVGQDVGEGVKLAVKLANEEGGVDGRQIEIETVDSQFDPNIGSQATTRFAKDDEIPLMIGSVETAVLAAQAPVANRERFPVIALVGTGPPKGGAAGSYVHYPYPGCAAPLTRLGEVVAGEAKTWGGIGWDDVAAQLCLDGFQAGTGTEFVERVAVPIPATDMSGPISKLEQADPEGLVVMAAGQTPGLIARQGARSGWEVPMYGWGGYTGSEDFPGVAGEAATGFKQIASWSADLADSQQAKTFVKAFEAEYNKVPSEFEAAGYDAALIALAALREAGTDREAINEYLASLQDFRAAASTISFDDEGYVIRDMYLTEWEEGGNLKGLEVIPDGSAPLD